MDLTSDHTCRELSAPVQTTDQTCRLLRQRRPDRPHLFSRAYMYRHTSQAFNYSNQKNWCGRYGQYGQPRDDAGFERPDLAVMVWTVGTPCMFHANRRRGWGAVRVLPNLVELRVARPQFARIFCVPSLVPVGTRRRP